MDLPESCETRVSCTPTTLERLGAQLGLPGSLTDLYGAIISVVQKALVPGTGIVLSVEGNKLVISMAPGLILPGENIVVAANPDGTYTISVRDGIVEAGENIVITKEADGTYVIAVRDGLVVGGVGTTVTEGVDGTYTVDFNGIASTATIAVGPSDNPYSLSLAPGALVAGTNVTITQAPDGVFTINSLAAGLLFWAEQYNALQGITSWDAVNTSVAAFRNITGFTLNKGTLNNPAAENLGADSIDLHQGQIPAFTVTGNNSGIFTGVNHAVSGAQSAIAAGFNSEITSSSAFIGAGTANRVLGSGSSILVGQNNTARGPSNVILTGMSNVTGDLWERNVIGTGTSNGAVVVATDVVTDSFIGGGVGNTLINGTTDGFIGAGSSHSVGGSGCAVLVGSTHLASGTNDVVLGGAASAITTDGLNCIIGAGSSNLITGISTASGIFTGQGNTINASLSSAVVAGSNNSVVGPASNAAVLAGNTNVVNTGGTNSSVLSGNNVTISLPDTHNFVQNPLQRSGHTGEAVKKDASGSSAGGSHVVMQASHSLAMGHQLSVENEASSSFTSGSYLTNTAPHSVLLGLHSDSSSLGEGSLTVGRGTLGDRRSAVEMGMDGYNKGTILSDSVRLSGESVAYLLPKSPQWNELVPIKDQGDVGFFVGIDESGHIYPTSNLENVIGVSAPRDGLLLNAQERHWHGKYKKDPFGSYITRTSYIDSFLEHLSHLTYDPITLPPLPTEKKTEALERYRAEVAEMQDSLDKERRRLRDEVHRTILDHDDENLIAWVIWNYGISWPELSRLRGTKLTGREVPVLSEDYDASRHYIARSLRTDEWIPVVQRGVVKVRTDGSCVVGRKCSVARGLASGDSTLPRIYRVLSVEGSVATILL